ncbi:DUF4123 domain-containing protein [Aestuariibius sp. 2305UL40-4]|uniref:DUF4123 domain-containing protein n=1 Tax=Aestuariibius violaceus TaxID=3234132 RepID=UPI00345EF3D0
MAWDPDWPSRTVPSTLEQVLSFDQEHVYAVIDAAKVFGLPELLHASELEHGCLYHGRAKEEWGDVAPWLVRLDPDHGLTRQLFLPGDDRAALSFQKAAALFLLSTDGFDAVAAHLRRFTKMRAEDGRVLMLRFYDPVTFSDLLDVMPPSQVAELHGPFKIVCLQANGTWSCTEAVPC